MLFIGLPEFRQVTTYISVFPENWFSVNVKEPIGFVVVEVVEGSDMKPSDLNGSSEIFPIIVDHNSHDYVT